MLGWHVINEDCSTVHGNLKVEVGKTLIHDGPLKLCFSGLHASRRICDALINYHGIVSIDQASLGLLCRVVADGPTIDGKDKFVATRRKCLWMYKLKPDDVITPIKTATPRLLRDPEGMNHFSLANIMDSSNWCKNPLRSLLRLLHSGDRLYQDFDHLLTDEVYKLAKQDYKNDLSAVID